jgi:hypothetical protein
MYKYKYKYWSKYAPNVQEMITKDRTVASRRDAIETRQFPYNFQFKNDTPYEVTVRINYPDPDTGQPRQLDPIILPPHLAPITESPPRSVCRLKTGGVATIHFDYKDPIKGWIKANLYEDRPSVATVCYRIGAAGHFPNIAAKVEKLPSGKYCDICR